MTHQKIPHTKRAPQADQDPARHAGLLALALQAAALVAIMVLLSTAAAGAATPCEHTAAWQFAACKNEVRDDYFVARAICTNLSNGGERAACRGDALSERGDGFEECGEVADARVELCEALDEHRYDPDFDPADFTDDFADSNPYFPLRVGNWWLLEGGDEVVEVQVLDETKNIEDVTCIVVNDVVTEDGDVVEDTDDWYAQALNGDVWYCGELARDFETPEGDDPEGPELVEIEGSFKHGRDGSKAGILMFAPTPDVGTVYRQEWSPSNAEDYAEIVATGYGFGNGWDEVDAVAAPHQALIDHFCSGDCLVTGDATPVEPDTFELKFYAYGIGLFLEIKPEDGEFVELVDCGFAACETIP